MEYAIISAAFIASVAALGALSDILCNGLLVQHAVDAASHGLSNIVGGVSDVFSF